MNRAPAPVQDEVLSIDGDGWLVGPRVQKIAIHDSWHSGPMSAGKPLGIVAHYTATNAGTAINMAKRRTHVFGTDPDDRAASWHITIETDGSIIVMMRAHQRAWHAGSDTAKPIPGIGNANANTVGIELVGFGTEFPPAQVDAACKVWRALVRRYTIPRQFAMISHQSIDPTRREDPGPLWMNTYAKQVLDFAYAV
jgi:N-acetyl-anhydromuramyl-L-alanine amidase AmpD